LHLHAKSHSFLYVKSLYFICAWFKKRHWVPFALLSNKKLVPEEGLSVEYMVPHGLKKVFPSVILNGELLVGSIGFPFVSIGIPPFVPLG
jgi:hypothetical protein